MPMETYRTIQKTSILNPKQLHSLLKGSFLLVTFSHILEHLKDFDRFHHIHIQALGFALLLGAA